MGRRCSLCGGKLVKNRCVLCGLDNSKSDSNYRRNQSSCDQLPLTHEHREREMFQVEEPAVKPIKKKRPVQTGNNSNVVGKLIALLPIILVAIGILTNMYSAVRDTFPSLHRPEMFGENNPYEYVEATLPEAGDDYDMTLKSGEYIVGVHIPEGYYELNHSSGEGYIQLEDFVNGIFISETISDENVEGSKNAIEDFRLFSGAHLRISDHLEVSLQTYNAQLATQQAVMENPLKESVVVDREMVAGVDFPAGVYDVTMQKSEEEYASAWMDLIVPGTVTEEEVEEYEATTRNVFLTEDGDRYSNLVIPEGSIVRVIEDPVILVPSEFIFSEDYISYYEYEIQ